MNIHLKQASICLGLTTLLLPSIPSQGARLLKPVVHSRTGEFGDRQSGSKHTWAINNAHSLSWDGIPYFPVGGTFTPRSFSNSSEERWKEDVAALTTLKSHGVLDLIISPDRTLTDIPVANLQRLLDYLDSNGFRYGLSFGAGLTTRVTGFVVRPSIYRYEDSSQISALWRTVDTEAAAYFIVDANRDSQLIRSGLATVRDNQASASLDVTGDVSRPVSLLIPHETPTPTPQGALPDLWSAGDNYRDRLLTYLAQIKPGAGLRFLLDPVARNFALTEETQFLVPDSDAFRLDWESFLTRKYSGLEEIRDKWLLTDDFKTIQDLCHLVPLWSRERGFPYMYDPSTGKTYRTNQNDTLHSRWWNDFIEWRTTSIRYYLNSLADVLKHRFINVPVVYTGMQGNLDFLEPDSSGGFDGIALSTKAMDPNRLTFNVGPALSLALQSSHPLWLLASRITAPGSGSSLSDSGDNQPNLPTANPSAIAYHSDRELSNDFSEMRRMGLKGLFVAGLSPSDADLSDGEGWLNHPDSLDWLHNYATALATDKDAPELMPRYQFYPQDSPGPAQMGLVPGDSGILWLPSRGTGHVVDWWPSYLGYTLARDEKSVDTLLMSLRGLHKARFQVQEPLKIKIETLDHNPVTIKIINKNEFEIVFGKDPLIFHTNGQELIPEQAASDILDQLTILTQFAKQQKAQSESYSKIVQDQAALFYRNKNYSAAYSSARQQLDAIMADPDAASYVWLEGENAIGQNFTEIAANPEASNGAYLRLSTPNPPHKLAYAARYSFGIGRGDTNYQIWLAGTPPGITASPITWYLDHDAEQLPEVPHPQGPLYLQERMGWTRLGTLKMSKGLHNITIKIDGPSPTSHLYSFAIDAILILPEGPMTGPFIPNGPIRPTPIAPETAKLALKAKKKSR